MSCLYTFDNPSMYTFDIKNQVFIEPHFQSDAGIIFGRDIERFAHFSAKNLIEISLMGEKFQVSQRFC